MQTNLQLFAAVQRDLISKEKACEVEEMAILHKNFQPYELQKRGLALIGLSVTAMRTGLGGKCLVDLEGGPGVNNLPAHKFRYKDSLNLKKMDSKYQSP